MRSVSSWEALAANESRPVAVGGELTAASVWDAFRCGVFPFPAEDPDTIEVNEILYGDGVADGSIACRDDAPGTPYGVVWWKPPSRPVVPIGAVKRDSKRVRIARRTQPWTTSMNTAFELVLERCRADREPRWLTDRLCGAFVELHEQGRAHSVEVWEGAELVGAAFGLASGGVFSSESAFHRRTAASRIALLDLCHRAAATSVTVVDLQTPSNFATDVGAIDMPGPEYLDLVHGNDSNDGNDGTVRFDQGHHPVSRL